MVKSIFLILIIGLAIVFSGCTGNQDVTSVVKALPEVQQFMNEHPNAKITVTYWSKEEVTQSLQEISLQCDKPITPVAMYKATVNEGDLKIISWINADTQIVICSITQGSGSSQLPTSTPIQTSTPKQTYVKAPQSSIVAANNPDSPGVDIKISHKGGDLLKAGEWKVSVVLASNPPVYVTATSTSGEFGVGSQIKVTSLTTGCTEPVDSACIITNSLLTTEGAALVSGTHYDVKMVHIPSNAMLMDTVIEVR